MSVSSEHELGTADGGSDIVSNSVVGLLCRDLEALQRENRAWTYALVVQD